MSESFRDRLQGDLEGRYEQLLAVVDEGLAATKKVWLTCPKCSKRSEVEYTDTKAALEAAEFIANQSLGRPGVSDGSLGDDQIILVRICGQDEDDAIRVYRAAEKFVPEDQFDDFLRAAAYVPKLINYNKEQQEK